MVSLYRAQRRGGKGKTGMRPKDEDFVELLFIASTHSYVLIFTDLGKVYWLKVHEIPQGGRATRGKAIVNLLQLSNDENRITSYNVCYTKLLRSTDETKYNLNGIYFKFSHPEQLSLVATDGHRLAMITRKIGPFDDIYQEKGVIFPKKGIYELKKISEEDETDVYLGFIDNNAFIKKAKTISYNFV